MNPFSSNVVIKNVNISICSCDKTTMLIHYSLICEQTSIIRNISQTPHSAQVNELSVSLFGERVRPAVLLCILNDTF